MIIASETPNIDPRLSNLIEQREERKTMTSKVSYLVVVIDVAMVVSKLRGKIVPTFVRTST